jgi:hypothetical protein
MRENNVVDLLEATERLEAVAEALETAAEKLAVERLAMAAEAEERVGRIVATVDYPFAEAGREAELERRLADAEAKIAELTAGAAVQVAPAVSQSLGRKTLPVGMVSMLAKQGVSLELGAGAVSIEASALDGALASLSIEQRIAVKAELRRAGLLG